jgi:hypothetical protein
MNEWGLQDTRSTCARCDLAWCDCQCEQEDDGLDWTEECDFPPWDEEDYS